ncbi:MAG: type II secretion system F family protein [Bryobacteraceae bacterium]
MLLPIIVFLVIVVVMVGAFLLMGGTKGGGEGERIRDRLLGKTAKVAKKKAEGSGETPALIKSDEPETGIAISMLKQFQLADRVNRMIETAGLPWTAAGLVQTALIMAFVAFLIVWYVARPPFDRMAWGFSLAAFAAPFVYVHRKGKARLSKFEELFPDSLEFVSRSMRAGHAFSVSLEMIHREFTEPLASEFRRTFDEQNLGLPLDVALQNLAKRVPLLEVHFFVSAVLLQKRTGGNLAELLDKLAYLIRERFKLRGRIRAVSAHGRLTATALSIIPMAVAFMMFLTNPEYILFFIKDETGHTMAGVAIGFQLVGYLIMKKIVQIEV